MYCLTRFITGFGFSLVYVSDFIIIASYFDENQRSVALGIVNFGSGVGSMFYPVFMQHMMDIYTWRGTFLISGGMACNMFVFGMVCSPLNFNSRTDSKMRNKQNSNIPTVEGTITCSTKENPVKEVKENSKLELLRNIIHVIKNKVFVMYFVSTMLTLAVLFSVLVISIDFFVLKGIDRDIAVWIFFGLTVTNCVFRLLTGFIAQVKSISKFAINCVYILLGGMAVILFPSADTVPKCVLCACLCGMSFGGIMSMMTITTIHLLGKRDYDIGLGISLTCIGIGYTIAGPVTGLLALYILSKRRLNI